MNEVLHSHSFANEISFEIVQGDITVEQVDAIVNAANEHLAHGGGLAAIIARKGSPVINAESAAWVEQHGPVTHKQPAYTSAGDMPARYVIHAVGPVWGSGDEDAKLWDAVTGSLNRAMELKLNSIALPAISTGIFGFPKERAARIMFKAIEAWCTENTETSIRNIRLTLFDKPSIDAFLAVYRDLYSTP
jgi:putative ATPase